MEKISVIIPTYKPDYYIWECLDSVKDQTLDSKLYEVLIILNGEKEPYYKEISNYITKNKLENFKLIYTDWGNVSNARNIGLDEAIGEYIAFLDDDDLIHRYYLEVMLNTIENKTSKDAIVAIENLNFLENQKKETVDLKKIELNNIKIKDYSIIQQRKVFSVVWGKLIPRKVIKNIKFNINYANGEDSLFMVEISNKIHQVYFIENQNFYYRRIRNNSAHFRRKSFKYILTTGFSMLKEYLILWNTKGYEKKFVFIRLLAIIKGIFCQIQTGRNQ